MVDLEEGTAGLHIRLDGPSDTLLHEGNCQRESDEPTPCIGSSCVDLLCASAVAQKEQKGARQCFRHQVGGGDMLTCD